MTYYEDSHDRYIEASTDWARIEWHRPGGAKGHSMARAELRKPCERPDCECLWTAEARGIRSYKNPFLQGLRESIPTWNQDPDWDDLDAPEERWLYYATQREVGFDFTEGQRADAIRVLARLTANKIHEEV